jgi:hypothetical protein
MRRKGRLILLFLGGALLLKAYTDYSSRFDKGATTQTLWNYVMMPHQLIVKLLTPYMTTSANSIIYWYCTNSWAALITFALTLWLAMKIYKAVR